MNQLNELFGSDVAEEMEQSQRNYEALQSIQPAPILSLFTTTQDQRNTFVDKVLEAVEEGQADPIVILTQLKSMEAIISTLTDKNPKTNKRADVAKLFSGYVLDAAAKYEGKVFNAHGAKFTVSEVAAKWDYSQCNDSELLSLEAAAKTANDALKERQTYLQNLPAAGIETLDKTSGDMVTIYKPSKSSTTALTVSLK